MCKHVRVRHTYECQLRTVDSASLTVVNEVAYADYLQEARIDMIRKAVGAAPPAFELRAVHIDFRQQLRFEEGPILIEVWVTKLDEGGVTLAYEISRHDRPRGIVASAATALVPVGVPERSARQLTQDEIEGFELYLEHST